VGQISVTTVGQFSVAITKWGAFEEITLKLPSWIVKQLKQNYHWIFHLETIVEDLLI